MNDTPGASNLVGNLLFREPRIPKASNDVNLPRSDFGDTVPLPAVRGSMANSVHKIFGVGFPFNMAWGNASKMSITACMARFLPFLRRSVDLNAHSPVSAYKRPFISNGAITAICSAKRPLDAVVTFVMDDSLQKIRYSLTVCSFSFGLGCVLCHGKQYEPHAP